MTSSDTFNQNFPKFLLPWNLLKSKSSLTSYERSTHGQPIYYAAFGLYRFDRKKFTGLWLDTKRHLPENFIHQLKAYFAQRTIFVAASNYAAGAVSFFSRGFLTWTDLADCLLIKSTNCLINKADKSIPSFKLSRVLVKAFENFFLPTHAPWGRNMKVRPRFSYPILTQKGNFFCRNRKDSPPFISLIWKYKFNLLPFFFLFHGRKNWISFSQAQRDLVRKTSKILRAHLHELKADFMLIVEQKSNCSRWNL